MDGRKRSLSDKDRSKKRVRMLLRVSSGRQLESDGDLTVQRQLVLEYVNSHPDWILDEKEYFEGGVSGYKNSVSERDELQRALIDAGKGEYDILVVYKDDRLGRKALEIPDYIIKLKTANVMVYSVKEGCLTPKDEDPMNIVGLVLKYAAAEKSSADTGMRVKDTAKKLVRSGKFMGGNPPYGYRLELSGEISKHGRALRHLVICQEQAEAVRYIYELSLYKEYGSAKIAKTLNTDERYQNLAPNDVWKSGTITSILTNPIYAGYTAYNRRESLNGRHRSLDRRDWILSEKADPDLVIIEEELWQEVQKKREMRGHKYAKSLEDQDVTVIKRNDGMLSLVDVLHCGYCGCKMVNGSSYNYWTIKKTGERRASRTAVYKCQNVKQGVRHEKTGQYRADQIEPAVYEILAGIIAGLQEDEDISARITENHCIEKKKREEDLERSVQELEKIRRNISIMESHIPDAVTGEYPLTLEDLVRSIDTQKCREEKQRIIVREKKTLLGDIPAGIRDRADTECKIPAWQELFLDADTAVKRILADQLIDRIDITKEQMRIRFKISREGAGSGSRVSDDEVVPE